MSILKQKLLIILLVTALTILGLSVGVALAQSVVDWWVIAGGGGPSSGGNVTLNDTLGQPIIGPAGNGSVALNAGYWYSPGSINADLTITKAVTPTTAAPGSTITYTLTFSNAGNNTASGVVITDFVPVSVTVQSVISSGDVVILHTTSSPTVEVFETASVASGQSGVITLTAVLSNPLASESFTNTATITTTSQDSNPDNNDDAASVMVDGLRFTTTPVTSATVDMTYSYSITATDEGGMVSSGELTITLATAPGWLSLTDNGDGTALLSGTPGSSDIGDHSVQLQVSNGVLTVTQKFTITVALLATGDIFLPIVAKDN